MSRFAAASHVAFALVALALAACTAPTAEKTSRPISTDKETGNKKKPGGTEIDEQAQQAQEVAEENKKVAAAPELYAFAHTQDTLFALDPNSRKATSVGKFKCLTGTDRVVDIAVDAKGKVFATTDTHFISVDPKTADCTVVGTAPTFEYPNSLSFVPAGTIDPTNEVLVGYGYHKVEDLRDNYVEINTVTGQMSFVGTLNPASATVRYESSGDLISLANDGNKAYLTVKPVLGGTDKLAEIDPKTGKIVRIVGDTGKSRLYGLAYWSGTAYGFSGDGNAYAIDMQTGVAVHAAMAGGEGKIWFGAGVSTRAPTK